MAETAGTKLQRARKLRKLGLEDASRATKIRVNQLADLESDEYSNFANLAYAKNFLVGYARYLHVDVRPYLEAFADAGTFGLDDYQYLSETPVGIYRAPHRQRVRRKPQRRQFVLTAMALGFLTIAAFVWMMVITLRRLPDWDKLAAREEARERAAHHAATEAVEQSAAATAPAQAPAVIVPVAEPVSVPANQATPVPSVAPMDESVRTVAGALASADTILRSTVSNPQLPVPGDGNDVRQMQQQPHPVATLTAGHPADAVHRDEPHPQKVANNQGRE